jgi:serine/threonine protein kinase
VIGKTVSRYWIVEKLGEGGMRIVYDAQSIKLDYLVEDKVLAPHPSSDKQATACFMNEARADRILRRCCPSSKIVPWGTPWD